MDLEFQLSDFGKYKTYFEAMAAESKHVDGFLFGDIEIAQEEAGSWQGLKLWAWPATHSRMTNLGADNYLLGREGQLWIGGPCSSEAHADEDEFYHGCEVIMKKMISKMIRDKQQCLISVEMNGHNLDRADTFAGATKLIGCQFIFTINDPEGFEYDQDDWHLPEQEPENED